MAVTILGGTGNDKFLFESDGTNLNYTNAADSSVKVAKNYGSAYLNFTKGSYDTLYFDGSNAISADAIRKSKGMTLVGGGFDDGDKNTAVLSDSNLYSVDILGNSDGLSIYGASGSSDVISFTSVKGSVELGSNKDSYNYYDIGEFSEGTLTVSAKNASTDISTILGGVTNILGASGGSTRVDLLDGGQVNVQNSIGSKFGLSIGSITGGSVNAYVRSGTGNTINLSEISGGQANIKLNDGTSAYFYTSITDGTATLESENADYIRLASNSKTEGLSAGYVLRYSDKYLSVKAIDSFIPIKASSVGGNVRFVNGSERVVEIDRVNSNLDKDGRPTTTTSTSNAGLSLNGYNHMDRLKIGDIQDDALFLLEDKMYLKNGSSFNAQVYYSDRLGISAYNAPLNIVGEVRDNICASVVGSYYADYIKLENTTSTRASTVSGGSGADVFDFTDYTYENTEINDFNFGVTGDVSSPLSQYSDVFLIPSFDDAEIAKFKPISRGILYDNRITIANYERIILNDNDKSPYGYYVNLATPDNIADTRCYQITEGGLVEMGATQGTIIAATGWTPQTIMAVGGNNTLDGGVNPEVNDTLISAGKYRNTTFVLHKNSGDNVAQNFDFGVDVNRNDVVAVDTTYSTTKLVKPQSGKVVIGSESEGSLTIEGIRGQNEFVYNYGGNIGVISADMSVSGEYMEFVEEANFHIGQGKNTTLVFTSNDSIECGVAGSQKGLGWGTQYISEGLGTIDASEGKVGAVLGSNDLDQTIIVSKNKELDEVWGGGGLDVGFSNGTNDTVVGSGNGNTVYFVGHKMGNDVLKNATAGDKVVFIDTKTTDLASFTGTAKEFAASFTNGTTVKLFAAENITADNAIIVQFDDVTYNWNGSSLTQNS